ncbi:DUF4124 domain-containing protein [Thioalkalivibrio sp.]|uniref:DUF4124 domain-containing protein n=1 Tax=Thioalkalivibrio sp. TaxID=2093813 RepID=UPI0012D5B5A7|nr:DUF4124 domain-containing protein [Thioalkalivibrio sp.]TVP82083.1 MAG: DUF4124 domain-containing protein [Thioalkalivibrio sp.]
MRQTIRRLALLLPLIFLVPPLDARIYRWVDDGGIVHYSTTPPPAASQREMRVLDAQGLERQVRPAPPTAEERARDAEARERQKQEALQRKEERARHQAEVVAREARARQLHRAYASVDEILEQRDRRLTMVENTLLLSRDQEATLRRERERIAAQIERAPADSGDLQRYRSELADLNQRIEREQLFQQRQQEAMNAIRGHAETDIRDFERFVVPNRN